MAIGWILVLGCTVFSLGTLVEGSQFCECASNQSMVVSFEATQEEPISVVCPHGEVPNISRAYRGLKDLAVCKDFCTTHPQAHWQDLTTDMVERCRANCSTPPLNSGSGGSLATGQTQFWYICFSCALNPTESKVKCKRGPRLPRRDARNPKDRFDFSPQVKDVTEAPMKDLQAIERASELKKIREFSTKEKTKFAVKLLKAKLEASVRRMGVQGRMSGAQDSHEAIGSFLKQSEAAVGLLSGALNPDERLEMEVDDIGSFSLVMRPKSNNNQGNIFVGETDIELPDQSSLRNSDEPVIAGVIKYKGHILESMGRHVNLSGVQSVTVYGSEGQVLHPRLEQDLTLRFVQAALDQRTEPLCVFWDFPKSNWSTLGCQTIRESDQMIRCECNHLTNFAVILNIMELDDTTTDILRLLTIVGCVLSSVGLAGTIFFFRTLNSNEFNERVQINEQFCLNLLVVQVLILFGMDRTDFPALCKVVALLLQYFLLVSFAWSLFAGHQIYVLLVEVFESEAKRMKKYFAIGYGVPILVVIVSLIVDHTSFDNQTYGSDTACWMSPNGVFLTSFLIPIILVTTANVIMLTLVMVKVIRIHPRPHFFSQARGWLSLALFLGATWIVGLLAKLASSYALAVIFAVLNAMQGFLIFCFHVLMGSKLRDMVKRKIKLHSEFSDDSRRNHTVHQSDESATVSSLT